ncbi:ADP-ribosylglycohydrolase family protein [Kocuria sediminis]|uniref:ADP-ribosylglycohydrolase family protein n=1 Tax=Kocuria sediminis TaxID=1038857 RepID=A0A6N8GF21_9MICC|nr:ADP-ribosylglycohydrolase family protein [Kocuria sediminis]MUN61786.1 ADP-ribosylglycohydrolase family protein [Kocuria sediminis]
MPGPLLRPDAGHDPARPEYADSVRAALLGGALGDAIGYRAGADAEQTGADGGAEQLLISDDTQLTLYTLDALLEVVEWANDGQPADETACLWLAYLRWLRTQGVPHPAEAPRPLPRRLDEHEVLHAVRNPARTVLEALRSGRMGEVERPLLPEAEDAAAVLRSAPFGLLPHVGWRTLAPLAINGAALTHGHPEAQTAAAVYGFTVHAAVRARREGTARPVAAAVAAARETAAHLTRPVAETLARLDDAVRAAGAEDPGALTDGRPGVPGTASTAPVVLAAGLWAALRAEAEDPAAAEPRSVFRRAVGLGTASGAAPEGTGSIAGAVTAAALGTAALPPEWLALLDARDAVADAAERWLREVGAPGA